VIDHHAQYGISELDALRRRAYGPDADIHADPDALARLAELEEAMRLERSAHHTEEAPRTEGTADTASESTPPPALAETPDAVVVSPSRSRAPRGHRALVGATAAVAVLLGCAAWSASRMPVTESGPGESSSAVAGLNDERDAAYRASYRLYIDGLRDDALSLPGGEQIADRMIRDSLRPYGILYGRTVAAGPTVDHRFCMIIADLPEASVTCIPVENAYANPVSVHLPAWYSDADSDLFTGLGELVAYTLMPGGSVVAEPASASAVAAEADAPVLEVPTPAATAVPPPGFQ
jgi:hypothetical protein